MREKHITLTSEKIFLSKILLVFLFTLLFTACGVAVTDLGENMKIETATLLPTIAPTATITPTPVPEYPITTIENFRDCYVPVKELLDGSYFKWLNDVIAPSLIPWFQKHEDKIKTDVAIFPIALKAGNAFTFDPATRPNFEDHETAPFKRDVTFGHTTWTESDGSTMLYQLLPVFYYDVKTQQVHPILTITPVQVMDENLISLGDKIYSQDMNMTPIIVEDTFYGQKDPLVSQFFVRVGDEMEARLERFFNGDFSALSDEDMLFLTDISASELYR
jgi:hypothetical protein